MFATWLNIIAVFAAGFAFGLWMPKGEKKHYRSILRMPDGYDAILDDCDSCLVGRSEEGAMSSCRLSEPRSV
jgi:hypothetical protein